jgi:hypothetical protein
MMSQKNQSKLFLAVCTLNLILFSTVMDTNGSPVRDFFQGLVVGISGVALCVMLWSLAKERKRRA